MLEKYRKKRDFTKTEEPEGDIDKNEGFLSFVVQKHRASTLHYDFRLEAGGVLKSWAVPKGPSLDPGVTRLAMMVEDHPYDYKDFEGVIAEGNYGAGEVIVWDRGNYLSAGTKNRQESEQKILSGIEKGHITFILNGEKLKGEFALIRTDEEKQMWILKKAGDQYASEKDILTEDKSVLSGENIENLKEKKTVDLAAYPLDKMPRDVKPMTAETGQEIFDSSDWLYEIKWDGYRAIAEVEKEKVYLYSRNGNRFNEKYPTVVEELKFLAEGAVLDGEIVVVDDEGKPHFQWLQDYGQIPRGHLIYYVFDILFLNGHLLNGVPLIERKEILKKIIPEKQTVKKSEFIEKEGKLIFFEAKKQGIEGIVAKKQNSLYRPGKRSREWLKFKTTKRQEFVIIGYTEPEAGRHYFSSLITAVFEKGKLIYTGNVGSGFDEKTLKELYQKMSDLKVSEPPVVTKIPRAVWISPELVAEVKFTEWTHEGTMRQPVYCGLREDKNPEEVEREA